MGRIRITTSTTRIRWNAKREKWFRESPVANSLGDPIAGVTAALRPDGRAVAAPSATPPTRTSSAEPAVALGVAVEVARGLARVTPSEAASTPWGCE